MRHLHVASGHIQIRSRDVKAKAVRIKARAVKPHKRPGYPLRYHVYLICGLAMLLDYRGVFYIKVPAIFVFGPELAFLIGVGVFFRWGVYF